MAALFGLDCLARFAPQIFGRALSIEGIFGSQVAISGRHDHIDSHTREMRAALEALSLLYRLASLGASGRRAAQILAYTHVVCGDEARAQSDTWVSVGLSFSVKRKKPSCPATCPL